MKLLFGSVLGLIGVILMAVGCPFLAVAAGMYYFFQGSTQNWVLVPGTVTGLSQSESYNSDSGGTSTTYCPSVAYQTTNGEPVELDLNECSSPPAYATGDRVEIYYNPANPHEAQLKGGVKSTISIVFLIVFGILGLLLTLGGLGSVVAAIVAALWPKAKPPTPPGYAL
jgi:Protein of unknown function (DUF3592)